VRSRKQATCMSATVVNAFVTFSGMLNASIATSEGSRMTALIQIAKMTKVKRSRALIVVVSTSETLQHAPIRT